MKSIKPPAGEGTQAKLVRSTIWTMCSKILSQGMGFLTTIVLARLLSKGDFGLMAMALAFIGLVDTFIDLGFLSAIIQAKEINRKQLSSCFWFLMALSSLVSAGVFIAAPLIAKAFAEQQISELIQYLAPIFVIAPLTILCKGILSRNLRLDVLAKIELYAGLCKMAGTVALAFFGMGVLSLVIGYLVERCILCIAVLVAANWYPRFEYDKSCMSQFIDFGSKITASSVLWYLYTRADVFVIGRVLGADALGVYSIAAQFPQTIARLLPATWNRIAYPLFAKYQQSPELKHIVTKSSSLLNLISLPLFAGLAALAPDAISAVFGPRWHEAAFPLQMLAIMCAIETAAGLLPSVLNAIGRPGINTVINAAAVVVFPVVIFLGAQFWGFAGVLWASIALYFYRYLAFLFITCRLIHLPVRAYAIDHSVSFVAAFAMFFVLIFFNNAVRDFNIYFRIIMCVFFGAVFYTASQVCFNKKKVAEAVILLKAI